MGIEPLKIKEITHKYGDAITASGQQINRKRISFLQDLMYDFNRIISDVNEEGTLDGEGFWPKDGEDWARMGKDIRLKHK